MYTKPEPEREPGAMADSPTVAAGPASASSAHTILRLQATAGNQAVQQLLRARSAPARVLQRRISLGEVVNKDKERARSLFDPLLPKYYAGQALSRIDQEGRDKKKLAMIKEATETDLTPEDVKEWNLTEEQLVEQLKDYETHRNEAIERADEMFYAEDLKVREVAQKGDWISRVFDMTAAPQQFGLNFIGVPDYWHTKAARVEEAWKGSELKKLPLWCDHATAMVVSKLARDSSFRSSLDVIKQGFETEASRAGHWFVLANRAGPISPRQLTANEFVIDLWGALNSGLSSTVWDSNDLDHSGNLHLYGIEGMESVMTVPEKPG